MWYYSFPLPFYADCSTVLTPQSWTLILKSRWRKVPSSLTHLPAGRGQGILEGGRKTKLVLCPSTILLTNSRFQCRPTTNRLVTTHKRLCGSSRPHQSTRNTLRDASGTYIHCHVPQRALWIIIAAAYECLCFFTLSVHINILYIPICLHVLMYILGMCHTNSCGSVWCDGAVGEDCAECGGHAMQRPCLICEGLCGRLWARSVDMVSSECLRSLSTCTYMQASGLFTP